ncbi:pectate lyase-like adhesive domain-containing protein [Enterococcus rivorum]|uniref:WxL domain-containing protein n=1 Tax=Enterococcus rivorum TaxID=762845 RepID=A0A1E5KX05_9ENTE|nr:pectate lyase-like adhesive domain-containing protein [Enterococcus rivorum]MBP2097262.1 hypothetical protein [Enterococcus rivorum]OEH82386.1 hypothetical protein BCR26_02845 [Enterococcus rivorum]
MKKSKLLLGLFLIIFIGAVLFSINSFGYAEEITGASDQPIDSTIDSEVENKEIPAFKLEKRQFVSKSGSLDVFSWETFIKALADPTVSTINITQSFAVPSNPRANLTDELDRDTTNVSGSSRYVGLKPSGIARKVVINGNGNTVDFGAVCITYYDRNIASEGWDLTWENLTIFHGNIYGFTTLNDLSQKNQQLSKMTYKNVINSGSQLIHSPYTDVFIEGKTSTLQVSTYTSPFRQWNTDGDTQINLYVSNVTVAEDATFSMSSLRGGNIHLVSGGNFVMKKNSKMTVNASQNDLTGEFDANQTNLYIAGGNITLEDGAEVNLTPKPQYAAISLAANNSNLVIGKGSKLFVHSDGHTSSWSANNRNIIYMNANSSLFVDEEGVLDVTATNMGASSTDIVYVAGTASFIVGKKGTLNIKSDSSSINQTLLDFNNSGSVFQFADAKQVDLQRTAAISGSSINNGLVSIAGSGGKLDISIQKVSLWNKDNFGKTPLYSWTPMYGILLRYAGLTPTIESASSLTQDNVDSFRNSFTTKNVQRVLFEYIPDVNISILSTATDDVTLANSMTIYGTTNPGAYVRLTDVPINSSVESVLPQSENKVKSPVTSSSSTAFTDNFTIKADSSGNYSYTLLAGRRLSAGTKIRAYSFLNGKTGLAAQVVLDVTPPKGEPRDYHSGKGAAVPDPKGFIKNPTDTNPVPQNFTYAYAAANSQEDIKKMLDIVGEHEVKVDLFDNAKNKTTITSKLIVHETTNSIDGKDIEIGTDVLSNMTEKKLKEYIFEQSSPTAQKIVDGVYTELTNKIQLTDLGGLTINSAAGVYQVTFTVKKADSSLADDLVKTISVTVINRFANITVQFINEKGTALHEPVLIEGMIGKTVDLTKEKTITDVITEIINKKYLVNHRPTDEEAVLVEAAGTTVQYKFEGTLFLESAPTSIDFGIKKIGLFDQKIEKPTYDNPLKVWDNRGTLSQWTMTATVEDPFKNQVDPSKILPKALQYKVDGGETLLLEEGKAVPIVVHQHQSPGSYNISDSWDNGKSGLQLNIPAGSIRKLGEYQATILWKLGFTP